MTFFFIGLSRASRFPSPRSLGGLRDEPRLRIHRKLNMFARAVETGSGSDSRPYSPLDSLDIACATGGSFSHRHPKLIKRALAKNENIR